MKSWPRGLNSPQLLVAQAGGLSHGTLIAQSGSVHQSCQLQCPTLLLSITRVGAQTQSCEEATSPKQATYLNTETRTSTIAQSLESALLFVSRGPCLRGHICGYACTSGKTCFITDYSSTHAEGVSQQAPDSAAYQISYPFQAGHPLHRPTTSPAVIDPCPSSILLVGPVKSSNIQIISGIIKRTRHGKEEICHLGACETHGRCTLVSPFAQPRRPHAPCTLSPRNAHLFVPLPLGSLYLRSLGSWPRSACRHSNPAPANPSSTSTSPRNLIPNKSTTEPQVLIVEF